MSKEKQTSDNFWSGFALGGLVGGALLYAFTSKRGRETVKKLLDGTETIEHNIENILEMLQKNDVLNEDTKEKKS
ncbi:MAG TPA: hypothetical protein PLS49_08890 [Candidatus Woesebacteria bacterium]|nr:hypothetical protein [Candidatus Woesebacteria bacterium]